MNKINIPVPIRNLPSTYIKVLNGVTGLSRKEIKVLEQLYFLEGELLSTKNRKLMQKRLDMSEYNLNNYLMMLKRKKVILRMSSDGKEYFQIHPNFIPKIVDNKVIVTFELEVVADKQKINDNDYQRAEVENGVR
jgi:DNA-binding CsgD family transcriptional regulator